MQPPNATQPGLSPGVAFAVGRALQFRAVSFGFGRGLLLILLWISILLPDVRAAEPTSPVAREALTILKEECLGCHNAEKKKGRLQLTSREAILRGGEDGKVVDLSHVERSRLLQLLTEEADPHMPPKKQIDVARQQVLKTWVKAGLPWDSTVLDIEAPVARVAVRPLPAAYHPAMAVRLSPDGSRLAVAQGGTLSIYEWRQVTNLTRVAEVEAHPEGIQSIAWTPDGQQIASGGFQRIALWSASNLQLAREWRDGLMGRITGLEISPDASVLLAADGQPGRSGILREIQLKDGALRSSWVVHGDTVFDLEFSQDGHRLVTGGGDRLIKVWEYPSHQLISVLEGHVAQVLSVAFNTNATLVASGGADRELKIWDVATHEKLIGLGQHSTPVTSVAWCSAQQTLFAGRQDGALFRYTDLKAHNGEQSSASGQEHRLLDGAEGVLCVEATRDGRTVIAAMQDGSIRVMTREGALLAQFTPPSRPAIADSEEHVSPRAADTTHSAIEKPPFRRTSSSRKWVGRIRSLRIDPSQLRLDLGSGPHQVLVTAATEEGVELDVTTQARFSASSRSPFDIDLYGAIKPVKVGHGTLTARFQDREVSIPVEIGAGTQIVGSSSQELSFVRDILPRLSRAGCNAGSCHAKPEGQNGFKLSVFSYDPKQDYEEIVKEARGRRVFPSAPEQSLLIQKPTGQIPHEGGVRFRPGSELDALLQAWMRQGMPFAVAQEPTLAALSVFPAERRYAKGATQRLVVQARYSDGSVRDVTRLAAFVSNDKEIAKVDEAGMVEIGTLTGQGVVVARYMGFVADAQILVPSDRILPESLYASLPRNNFIDDLTYDQCRRLGIVPSELCTDVEFLRRSKLDAIGQLPTAVEVKDFLADKSPDKRKRWIARILDDPAYVDFWANKWADLLRPNPDRVGVKSVFVLDQWIRESFQKNQPYDQFVREILLAEGSNHRDGPAVIYRDRREPADLTTMFTQLFLGTRLECARCHHHPNEKWGQEDFYQFAAFFGPLKQKGAGLSPPISAGTETFYFSPGGSVKHPVTGKVLPPRVPEGQEVTLDAEVDPRQALADWLTARGNPFFAKAAVNRIWSGFFGRGLVEPVDDFRISNPCVNPALLSALAADFVEHHYDRKHVMRTIMESRTYQLSTTPTPDNLADTRHFSRGYRRRLSAEVLMDAVNTVTGVPDTLAAMPIGSRATQVWSYKIDSQFLDAFGRPNASSDCPCERDMQMSVVQSLHMMNSKNLQAKLASSNGRLQQWVESSMKPEEMVDEIYLTTLGRFPTPPERARALSVFSATGATRRSAAEDLCWALLNSPEFVFNH